MADSEPILDIIARVNYAELTITKYQLNRSTESVVLQVRFWWEQVGLVFLCMSALDQITANMDSLSLSFMAAPFIPVVGVAYVNTVIAIE